MPIQFVVHSAWLGMHCHRLDTSFFFGFNSFSFILSGGCPFRESLLPNQRTDMPSMHLNTALLVLNTFFFFLSSIRISLLHAVWSDMMSGLAVVWFWLLWRVPQTHFFFDYSFFHFENNLIFILFIFLYFCCCCGCCQTFFFFFWFSVYYIYGIWVAFIRIFCCSLIGNRATSSARMYFYIISVMWNMILEEWGTAVYLF